MGTLEEKPVMTEAWMPPAMTMRGMEAVTTSVIFQPLENAIRYATANVTRFCTSSPTCTTQHGAVHECVSASTTDPFILGATRHTVPNPFLNTPST